MTIYILIYFYMYLQLLLIDKNSSNTKMMSRSGNHHRKTDNKGL